MLRNLHIKHMALIDELDISFQEGLNVLTGETGAGKSIILGAINIGLGGKTGKEMLLEGSEYGLVELLFEINDSKIEQRLEELGVDLSEEKVLIIQRKIYPNRTTNKINDEMVTVGRLREIAPILLDIHSQHENQSLLKASRHLLILDEYGKERITPLKEEVKEAYSTYADLLSKQKNANLDEEARKRQIDFAEYEINEIQEAALTVGEEEELTQSYRRMNNAKELMVILNEVYQYMSNDGRSSARDLVGKAMVSIAQAVKLDEEAGNLEEQLLNLDSLMNDFSHDLTNYIEGLSFDEETFAQVEQRLEHIHRLEAKYGNTIEEVLAYQEKRIQEYEELKCYEEMLEQLALDIENALRGYEKTAHHLSEERKTYARKLQQEIKETLIELNFNQVEFEICFVPVTEPAKNGAEEVYFAISTNVGMALRPLWEVASGGELSRIMLAVKSCLATEDEIETLIFDEIDVGISGRTAQKVSENLAKLGRGHQVLCISHLPQIAAMADVHYKIEKTVVEGKTYTSIACLDGEQSEEELARLIGGVEITALVKQNAKEMREMARTIKMNK